MVCRRLEVQERPSAAGELELSGPDQERAREKYRRIALTAPLRRRAVDRLGLAAGETCLEVACGTGINFDLIEQRIGPGGQLIGLDLSPEMLAEAEARIERRRWSNISLVEAGVEEARLPAAPDALLFSLTHDVLQLPDGLANVFSQAKPGARVAAVGPKLASRLPRLLNPVVKAAARPYVTTLDGLDRPWRHLERHAPGLTVRPLLGGGAYVAWGKFR